MLQGRDRRLRGFDERLEVHRGQALALRQRRQPHLRLGHDRKRAFRAHDHARQVHGPSGREVVQVVAGDAAHDLREAGRHLRPLFSADPPQLPIDAPFEARAASSFASSAGPVERASVAIDASASTASSERPGRWSCRRPPSGRRRSCCRCRRRSSRGWQSTGRWDSEGQAAPPPGSAPTAQRRAAPAPRPRRG